jgi:hypothetical protein
MYVDLKYKYPKGQPIDFLYNCLSCILYFSADSVICGRLLKQWNDMRAYTPENCWAEPRDRDGQVDLSIWDAIIYGPISNTDA